MTVELSVFVFEELSVEEEDEAIVIVELPVLLVEDIDVELPVLLVEDIDVEVPVLLVEDIDVELPVLLVDDMVVEDGQVGGGVATHCDMIGSSVGSKQYCAFGSLSLM